MASTYSSALNLELQTTGENSGTWGTIVNNNLQKLESATKGYVAVAIASTTDSLSATDGSTTDEQSNAIIKLTGSLTGNTTMQCEAVESWYIVDNATTMGAYTLNFKPAGGSGTTDGLIAGSKHILYTDGTNMFDVLDDCGNITANGTLDVAGNVSFDGGTFIYNEAGADLDARFEGASDANLLFLDAGNDRVGIGTASPSKELHVVGGIKNESGTVNFDGGLFVFNESGADYDFRIEGDADTHLFFTSAGNDRVGIGVSSPAAKMEIDQSSLTGAIPCLELDQADTDQPFIKFDGDSQSDTSGNITTDTSIGDLTGYIRVNVEGTDRWIPYYATS